MKSPAKSQTVRIEFIRRPAGSVLLETVVAVGLLAVVMSMVAQVLVTVGRQRSKSMHRQVALETATNCLHRLHAMPLEELQRLSAPPAELASLANEALPAGTVQVEVTPAREEPRGLRITVAIAWSHPSGQQAAPVRLVAWRWHDDR